MVTVIGITGPTGAGKTTLLREVERLGGAVIDCDAVYHEMLERDASLQFALEAAFGPLRDASGGIDCKKLGTVVFGDPGKLKQLNTVVQGAVSDRARRLIEAYGEQGRGLVAVDAISLIESPLMGLCKPTVAVLAPPQVRVERIMAREGIVEDYAWSRVRAQKPDRYFIQHCDHTLINDCSSAEEFSQKARDFLKEVLS